MDVSQLLIEFRRIANVAVVVALLPERTRAAQPLGKRQFEKMHRIGQSFRTRLANQQVNVFGHDDVSVNAHLEAQSHAFERLNKEVIDMRRCEVRAPLVTTECEEMGLPGFVESSQSARHAGDYTLNDHAVSVTAQVSATKRREPGAPSKRRTARSGLS